MTYSLKTGDNLNITLSALIFTTKYRCCKDCKPLLKSTDDKFNCSTKLCLNSSLAIGFVNLLKGFAYHQPHGYAGDYEIIDRIYTKYISKKDHLKNWDLFFHSHLAAQAVRNRVEYLENCLKNYLTNRDEEIQILNLASGSCRDIKNFLDKYLESPILFDCVEQDNNAINFAINLCSAYLTKINFIEKNALKFKTNKLYHLIWSAGLFDYFNDKIFILMLKRLSKIVHNNGEIVIGNFSTNNPSRYYMEIFKWNIYHRSPTKLVFLAKKAGFYEKNITIKKESTGVNLFLHIKVSN